MVQFASERLLRLFAQQVRTAKRIGKEEVSAEESDWLGHISFLVEENKAEPLRGMARWMERNQAKLADPQPVTVPKRMVFHPVAIRLAIIRAEGKLRTHGFSKGERAGNEISMDVGLSRGSGLRGCKRYVHDAVRAWPRAVERSEESERMSPPAIAGGLAVSLLIGMISGMIGIAGGAFRISALIFF